MRLSERLPGQLAHERSPAISSREDTPYFHGRAGSIQQGLRCAPKAKSRVACGCAKAQSPAPFPNFQLPKWRSSSFRFFLFLKGKARLGAFDDAREVPVMVVNDEHSDGQRTR